MRVLQPTRRTGASPPAVADATVAAPGGVNHLEPGAPVEEPTNCDQVGPDELRIRIDRAVRGKWLAAEGADDCGDPRERIAAIVAREAPLLSEYESASLIDQVTSDVLGLGVIEELLSDPNITDVMVNGPGHVWVERSGQLERTGIHMGLGEIQRCVERLVAPLGLRADRANPVVDARMADGSRVSVVLPPLAPHGPIIAVRRHPVTVYPLVAFASHGGVEILERIVAQQLNVVIYGSTGSGKTSLLSSMAAHFHPRERVIVVEDRMELTVPGAHTVRLETRPPTFSGAGGITIRDMVRVSLRLRPDRLIVGEVRGAEAVDMIWAMSTGHRGSISTCHAASASDALMRLETMMLLAESNLTGSAVRDQIHSAVDVLVGVRRSTGGKRVVDRVHLLRSDGWLREVDLRRDADDEP